MNDVARLQKGLDPSDRRRLGNYLDDVREVERRIQRIEKYNASGETRNALQIARSVESFGSP